VDVPEPEPTDDSVRAQARESGAARFCRGEGLTFHDGSVFVCCTWGGRAGAGQLFKLTPSQSGDGDRLELFAESPGASVLDMPDNICMTPWGDLLLAEDGLGEQFLRGITPDGRIYNLARNARSSGEFAGVCCSPSGDTVFVNLQIDGLTLALRGPFSDLAGAAKPLLRRRA
jgi:secreted PhoX family phosphatase